MLPETPHLLLRKSRGKFLKKQEFDSGSDLGLIQTSRITQIFFANVCCTELPETRFKALVCLRYFNPKF